MKKMILLTMISASLGGLIAVAAWENLFHPRHTAIANELTGGLNDAYAWPFAVGNSAAPPLGPAVSSAEGEQGLAPLDDAFTAEERINIRIYESTNRGVVNINARGMRVENFFMVPVPSEGSGSGWVLDKSGHIVTNHHVIAGSTSLEVTLFDGSSYPAQLVGEDPQNDIALLKINADPDVLFPLQAGDSGKLQVGQRVFAIGNPFGLERTMTVGIISSLNRTLASQRVGRLITDVIQLDAALNQGNSGGPLFDSSGRMVGMNTAIASTTGGNSGVGFAIPINTIGRVIPELIRFGKVIRASLGIRQFVATNAGLKIVAMDPNGAAAKAGLRGWALEQKVERLGNLLIRRDVVDPQKADTILAIDGQPIESIDKYNELIGARRPGDQITLTILRAGRRMDVPITLGTE